MYTNSKQSIYAFTQYFQMLSLSYYIKIYKVMNVVELFCNNFVDVLNIFTKILFETPPSHNLGPISEFQITIHSLHFQTMSYLNIYK